VQNETSLRNKFAIESTQIDSVNFFFVDHVAVVEGPEYKVFLYTTGNRPFSINS
jgi:hypothetical protein